jgi:MFS family permease
MIYPANAFATSFSRPLLQGLEALEYWPLPQVFPHTRLKKSSTYGLLGIVSDLWEPKYAGRVGLSYIIAPFLGPSLGPLTGAYVIAEYDNNWKYAICVIMMILAPVTPAIVYMQETSKRRILYLRAKRRGSDLNIECKSVVVKRIGKAMLKPLHMCLVEVLSCHLLLTLLIFSSRSLSSSVSTLPLVLP